jgi:hypothetical protein
MAAQVVLEIAFINTCVIYWEQFGRIPMVEFGRQISQEL